MASDSPIIGCHAILPAQSPLAMRYPWPDGKQSAVVLSFDFDAESGFLFREPEKEKKAPE